ncbi:MAG: hypothetical protein AAGJ19_21010 [Myxococcota bacterium]
MTILPALMSLCFLGAPPVQNEDILYFDGDAAASVFEDEAYAFCRSDHRPRYVTLRTCALASLPSHGDCPGLASACDELTPAKEPDQATTWSLGAWAEPLRWLVLVVLLLLLANQLRRLRGPPQAKSQTESVVRQLRRSVILPNTPARAIFEEAENALRGDDPPRALALVQQGLQRYIQDQKILAFDPALTHRDYLRHLRRRPELAAVYRPFAVMANRMRFGDGAVDRNGLVELLARCRSLMLGWVMLFSVACSGGPRPPSFDSHEPNGLSALIDMLRAWGYEVELFVGEVDPDTDYDLLIARTVPFVNYDELGGSLSYSVYERALEGWPMVILDDAEALVQVVDGPSRRSTPAAPSTLYGLSRTSSCGVDPRFFLEQEEVSLEVPFMEELGWLEGELPRIEDSTIEMTTHALASRIENEETRSIANLYTFRFEDTDYVVDTCVVHFASSALASNEALTRPENRAFVLSLMAGLAPNRGRIAVVDALGLANDGEPNRAQLQSSPALPVLLQLGLCLLLWYWARGMSFGVLRDPTQSEERPFVEHAEALGGHYAASGSAGIHHLVRTLAQALGPRVLDPRRTQALAKELGVSHDLMAQSLAATREEPFNTDPMEVAKVLSRLIHEGR